MWELVEEELAVWALASSAGLYATANQRGGTRAGERKRGQVRHGRARESGVLEAAQSEGRWCRRKRARYVGCGLGKGRSQSDNQDAGALGEPP
jgi:hypothetical protein